MTRSRPSQKRSALGTLVVWIDRLEWDPELVVGVSCSSHGSTVDLWTPKDTFSVNKEWLDESPDFSDVLFL